MKPHPSIKSKTWRDNAYNFYHPKHLWRYIRINAIIAFVISIFFCPDCLSSAEGIRMFFIDYFIYSFVVAVTLSYGVSRIIAFSDLHFSWLETPVKRLAFDLFAVGVFSFITGAIFSLIFGVFVWQSLDLNNLPNVWDRVLSNSVFPTIISLGITLFFTSRSFFLEWRQAAVESEQMRSERLASQYQSLKDQLNPHFLFNSLNVLSNLVHENPEQANAFIDKLSRIYRYVLDVQNEELVELEEELSFAQSYLELQKMRFGDKLDFTLPTAEKVAGQLPPLSLQLLLENAIKHNSATREKPLFIHVEIKGQYISVSNSFNPLAAPEERIGIGLKNIQERYRFLTEESVSIDQSQGKFRVELPIIQIDNR